MLSSGVNSATDLAAMAFQYSPIGMVYAEHRLIIRANDAFIAMFELTGADVEGLALEVFYPSQADSERTVANVQDPLRLTGLYSDERTMQRVGGSLFWCGVTGHSITPVDPLARVVWCFTDLSKQWNLSGLSVRDREIAILTCEGRTAKEIARLLDLSPRTVEAYLAKLKHKLAVRNVAELVSRIRPENEARSG